MGLQLDIVNILIIKSPPPLFFYIFKTVYANLQIRGTGQRPNLLQLIDSKDDIISSVSTFYLTAVYMPGTGCRRLAKTLLALGHELELEVNAFLLLLLFVGM